MATDPTGLTIAEAAQKAHDIYHELLHLQHHDH